MADYTETATFGLGMASTVDRDVAYLREAESAITVGSEAIDRAGEVYLFDWGNIRTWVDGNNPANTTGIIHTVKIYIPTATAGNNIRIGTFRAVGNNLTCISAVTVGEGVAGLNIWTNLSLPITAGDYIGADSTTTSNVKIDRDTVGFTRVWFAIARYCESSASEDFSPVDGHAISLQGIGAGGIVIGLAASVDRDVAYQRTGTLGAGLAATITRAMSYLRTATEGLGLAVSISRGFFESASLTIGFSVWANRILSNTIFIIKSHVKKLYTVLSEVKHLYRTKGDEW